MGTTQSNNNEVIGNHRNQEMPELKIKTESWTRESHGLYDYEGTELEVLNYTLKGNLRFKRTDSKVTVEKIQSDQLEDCEKDFNPEERDKIICRFFYNNDSYWVYHKNFVDETAQQVSESKPEEKIWQVVKRTNNPEIDFPCYKISKKDLIKVGRVRFKIRDVMSPVYKKIQEAENLMCEKFNMMYPSFNDSSIADSDTHSSIVISGGNEVKKPRINSFERMGDHFLNVSDRKNGQIFQDYNQNVNPQPVLRFSGMNLNQVHPDDDLGYDQNQVFSGVDVYQLPPGNQQELSVDSVDFDRLNEQPQFIVEKKVTALLSAPVKENPKKFADCVSTHSQKEAPVCRICLLEDNEQSNPLFSPCKCSGSMKYIHHLCLKTWFQGKRIMKVNPVVTTYFWKNLECELCKQPYPYETKSLDGKEWLNIIEYDTPVSLRGEEIYYVVLESISSNTSKVIHVVNMEKTQKLYIGRGHDAHVRVTDISVSRLHAYLIKSPQGFFYLVDNQSKFGTLALVKTPLEIKPQVSYELQIGRTIFTIQQKKATNNIFQSCICMPKQKKPQQKQKSLNTTENMISLNGLEYFPKEFASATFLDSMKRRKQVSVKLFSKRLKKKAQDKNKHEQLLVKDTEQEESNELQNVDDFIAMQVMSNEQLRLRQQASLQQQQAMEQLALQQQAMAQEFGAGIEQSEQEYDEEEEGEGESDESLQREEEENSESEHSQSSEQYRQEQLEQEQLERAISESLAMQQRLDQERQQRLIQERQISRLQIIEEEIKVESPNQDEKQKFTKNDLFPEPDLVSNISTARISQNINLFEQRQIRLVPMNKEINQIEKVDQLVVEDNLELSDQNIPISLMEIKERNDLTPKPKMLRKTERDSQLETQFNGYLSLSQKMPGRLQTTRVTAIREIIGEEDDAQEQVNKAVVNMIQGQDASRQNQRQIISLNQQVTGQATDGIGQQTELLNNTFNNNNTFL